MDEVYNFLNELIDEFGAEGTISHDTFNKAINLRSNIIADSDPCEGENAVLQLVSGSTFTKDELQTIKIDILHIYDKVSLSEIEAHKRNLILNKLKILLGEEYCR